jgi:hypothetical protein
MYFITWYQILYRINLVSKSLQDKAVNTDLISQVKNYFIELRSDKGFEEILVDAKDLADTLEVESEFQQSTRIRPRRVKRQFNYESEDHLVVESNQEFKINFFFILDKSINSLDERFEQLRNHNIFHFRYNINGEINSKNLFKKCQYFQLSLTDGNHRDVFFLYMPFPFFAIRLLRYLSVGRLSIPITYILCLSLLQMVRRGSGALSPTTHAHSTSHSQTYTKQHLYTHGRPSRRDSNPC